MNNIYYVYFLINPLNNQIFYIGKGKNYRCLDHFKENKQNTENKFKYYIIQSIKEKGLWPIINIISSYLTETESYKLESFYIKLLGRIYIDNNGILTNRTTNEKPPNNIGKKRKYRSYEEQMGEVKAKERKLKSSNNMKGNNYAEGNEPWNKGKTGYHIHSDEWKLKRSEELKGIPVIPIGFKMTEKSNEKRRQWNIENNWQPKDEIKLKKGHKWSEESIKKRIETRKINNLLKKQTIQVDQS